jgi:hypothetical protein
MKKLIFLLFSSICIIISSCKNNDFNINVANIDIDLEFKRFDTLFTSLTPENLYLKLPDIEKEYAVFFDLYNNEIIGIGSPYAIDYSDKVNEFQTYCKSSGITKLVNETFPISDSLENSLTDAFKHYNYYFHENYIPSIITCISAVGLSVFTTDSIIGISLDKYLGKDCIIYDQLGIDQYMQFKMDKHMIGVDCMRAWCMGEFSFNDSVNTLLSNMIYEGRIQYFLDAMLPETNDTLKWGYSYQQFKWSEAYEKEIWDYLVEEKILFSSKLMDIKTFTGESPFTTPFHNISAPRAGTVIGYEIVKSFMKNNKNITLSELMKITDYTLIYNNSKYNP